MATPNFKIQVEQFFRRVGQGNIVITYLANAPVYTPLLTKYTSDQIYDYYQFAGQCLFRAIERYSKNQLSAILPSFIRASGDVTLTAGSYTFTETVERIIEPVTVWIDPVNTKRPANKIPDGIVELCKNSIGIRTLAAEYPGYYLKDNSINVLPTTLNRANFNYVTSVPRIQLTDHTTTYKDIWPSNVGDLLIDGMVMLAKGDAGDTNLEQYYFSKLSNLYKLQAAPISNNNNSLGEQI